jgi:hypothetical protein
VPEIVILPTHSRVVAVSPTANMLLIENLVKNFVVNMISGTIHRNHYQ